MTGMLPLTDSHLRTLLLCLLAGGSLAALGLPLGWMVGALVATAYLAMRDAAAVPVTARPAGLIVVGLALGQGFTPQVLDAVVARLPAMLGGALLVLAAGIAVVPLYRRIAGGEMRTAFFACVPGGVVAMAALAAQAGAAVPAVTLAQSLRMTMLVLAYPALMSVLATRGGDAAFLAPPQPVHWGGLILLLGGGVVAALVGRWTGLANRAMLAPCLLAMALAAGGALPSSVPGWLVDAAQLALGASLGMHLAREGIGGAPRRLVMAGIACGLVVSLLLVVAGFLLGWVAGLPMAAVVLGLAPGGMPEMLVTAQALGLAVPLVLGFHLVRMVLISLLALPLWRATAWLGRRRDTQSS